MKKAVLKKGDVAIVGFVEQAIGFRDRLIGLLGRDSLGAGRGMFLSPCRSIHTFFMRFPLDLVFFDCNMAVTKIVRGVSSGRIVFGGIRSRSVLELEAGWLSPDVLKSGDSVYFESF